MGGGSDLQVGGAAPHVLTSAKITGMRDITNTIGTGRSPELQDSLQKLLRTVSILRFLLLACLVASSSLSFVHPNVTDTRSCGPLCSLMTSFLRRQTKSLPGCSVMTATSTMLQPETRRQLIAHCWKSKVVSTIRAGVISRS